MESITRVGRVKIQLKTLFVNITQQIIMSMQFENGFAISGKPILTPILKSCNKYYKNTNVAIRKDDSSLV